MHHKKRIKHHISLKMAYISIIPLKKLDIRIIIYKQRLSTGILFGSRQEATNWSTLAQDNITLVNALYVIYNFYINDFDEAYLHMSFAVTFIHADLLYLANGFQIRR